MKKFKLHRVIVASVLLVSGALFGCTSQERARNYGGSEEVVLKPHEKLINITWKDDDMWILTEDTTNNIKYFRESSSWGIWEGEITIK